MTRKTGTPHADRLTGSSTDDVLLGLNGNDILTGLAGNDRLDGGDGNDRLDGGAGNDLLVGGAGNDDLQGGDGRDTLIGGTGVDRQSGGNGNDVITYDAADTFANGGAGYDKLVIAGAHQTLNLTALANGKLVDFEAIDLTGSGNNTLVVSHASVLALSSTSDGLRVDGNRGDSVQGSDVVWQLVGNVQSAGQTYAQYIDKTAVLQIDADLARDIQFRVELSSLAGANGFELNGEAAGDHAGSSVASAGDVNGDAYDDFLVGAFTRTVNSENISTTYVVFGKPSGFPAALDLSSLDGNNGFALNGEAAYDRSGTSVASAGDINGDGFDDLLVGARLHDATGHHEGASYVVFGHASGFAPRLDLATLNGSDGLILTGAEYDGAGISVASAGDVNGDGYADMLVGGDTHRINGVSLGTSYVVFGHAPSFSAAVNLASMAAGTGFRIDGESAGSEFGCAVASAGDVNGDGYADMLVGAFTHSDGSNSPGAAYLVFGGATPFGASLAVSSLNGSNGFKMLGAAHQSSFGDTVASLGDINGDGLADFVIGAPGPALAGGQAGAGASYVVLGRSGGFAASLDVASLDGTNGFAIFGANADDHLGISVSSAGDIDGDGFDDILVASRRTDVHGADSGSAYVMFGKSSGFSASIHVSSLTGADGFAVNGESAQDDAGRSVSSAGDVNGDGFADLVIGALGRDINGANAGAAYVFHGGDFRGHATAIGGSGNDVQNGTAGNDALIGGRGNDSIDGAAGIDVLIGGGGDDVLNFDLSDRIVDGGGGDDRAALQGSDITLVLDDFDPLTSNDFHALRGIEIIDITGSGDNEIQLTLRDVLNMAGNDNTLRIDGDDGDSIVSTLQGWLPGDLVYEAGTLYQSYLGGAATLLVDTDLIQTVT